MELLPSTNNKTNTYSQTLFCFVWLVFATLWIQIQNQRYLPQTVVWTLQLAFLPPQHQKKSIAVLGAPYCWTLPWLRWSVLQPRCWQWVGLLHNSWEVIKKKYQRLQRYHWWGGQLRPVSICIITYLPVAERCRWITRPIGSSIKVWQTL